MSQNPPGTTAAIWFATCLVILAGCDAPKVSEEATPPNIVYILADDLGYGEVGVYGQEKIRTPNIDRLATEGMLFTQHYSGSPVCAPSRGTLLTGQHTGNAYIRDNKEMGGWGPEEPEGQLPLPDSAFTIPELMKHAGYQTAVIGKWGLGGPDSEGHPNNQGVDHFYGYLCQRVAHNYYPTHLWRNDEKDMLPGNSWFSAHQKIEAPLPSAADYEERYAGTTYAPDKMLDESISFIRQNAEKPFFLLYASPIPHVALQVPQPSVAEYVDAFPETPYLGQKSYLPHPAPRAAYAAMITHLDNEVGRIMEELDALGIADNTIVMFSSDNGPTYAGGADQEFFESAGPLRGLKGSLYEGGVRVPMIAKWPRRIKAGSQTEHVSAFWDIMPTLADAINMPVPEWTDGISFLPTLVGDEAQAKHDYLYWEYHSLGGMQAVRMGDWKGVRTGLHKDASAAIQLYDLSTDLSEFTDVSVANPEVVARIAEFMDARKPSAIEDWNFALRAIR